jgi:hypothetical protein
MGAKNCESRVCVSALRTPLSALFNPIRSQALTPARYSEWDTRLARIPHRTILMKNSAALR